MIIYLGTKRLSTWSSQGKHITWKEPHRTNTKISQKDINELINSKNARLQIAKQLQQYDKLFNKFIKQENQKLIIKHKRACILEPNLLYKNKLNLPHDKTTKQITIKHKPTDQNPIFNLKIKILNKNN